ncbi:MAG: hypothetical protein WED05_02650 [Candidatus Atabeyarchaeum deiterrae]
MIKWNFKNKMLVYLGTALAITTLITFMIGGVELLVGVWNGLLALFNIQVGTFHWHHGMTGFIMTFVMVFWFIRNGKFNIFVLVFLVIGVILMADDWLRFGDDLATWFGGLLGQVWHL